MPSITRILTCPKPNVRSATLSCVVLCLWLGNIYAKPLTQNRDSSQGGKSGKTFDIGRKRDVNSVSQELPVADGNATLTILPQDVYKLVPKQRVSFLAVLRGKTRDVSLIPVKWSSTNTKVISISKKGAATAHKPGVAQITATLGTLKAVFDIQVLESLVEFKGTSNELSSPISTTDTQGVRASSARLLDDEVTGLLNDLKTAPTQALTDRSADLISRAAALGRESDLESALRELLKNEATANLIVVSLGRYRVPEFDGDLATALLKIKPTDFGRRMELLLKAVASSGSHQCIEILSGWVRIPFQAPPTGPSREQLAFRRQLWESYFSLAPLASTSQAIAFYNTAGRFELENDSKAAEMLIAWINRASKDGESLIRLLNDYNIFLGRDRTFGIPNSPPLDIGSATSQRFRVCKAIEQSLLNVENPSPVILSTLLRFTQAADPALSEPALRADYQAIERAPWLLPLDSLVFTNNDINSQAWALMKPLKIGLPRTLFLPESKYQSLLNYEKLAAARGAGIVEGNLCTEAEVTDKHNSFVDAMFRYLTITFALESSGIRPKLIPPFDAPESYPYLSLRTVSNSVSEAVITAIQSTGQSRQDSGSLSGALVAKEFERHSLVLYSILAARRRLGIPSDQLDLSSSDEELDRLSESSSRDARILKTELVEEIRTQKPAGSLNTELSRNCGGVSFELVSRNYSFNQGLYEENINVLCKSGDRTNITWIGPIPITLVLALRRHPRLLDFPSVSLAARELRVEAVNSLPLMDDIDYVRTNPTTTIPYLAAAIINPNIPWSHVRDSIVLESNSGIPEYFISATGQAPPNIQPPLIPTPNRIPGLDELSQSFLDAGLPGGIGALRGVYVADSDSSFEADAQAMQKPLANFWGYRALRLEAERVRPHVENIDTNKPCFDPVCWALRELGKWHDEQKEENKRSALKKLNQAIADGSINETYLQAWDLGSIRNANITSVILRQMVLRPNLSEFFAIYEIRTAGGVVRFLVTGGKLNPMPEFLIQALMRDPFFLSRYNIDLAQMSEGANARLGFALVKSLRADSAIDALNRTGFYPLGTSNVRLQPSAPLYKTMEGRIRATEMTVLSEIWDWATGEILPANENPKPAFLDLMNSQLISIETTINKKVQDDTQPIIDEIEKTQKKEWIISVTVNLSGAVPVYSASVTYGSLGINLSTTFGGTVTISGSLNGLTTPFGLEMKSATPEQPNTGADIEQNRDALDAALAYVPTKMAVAGTSFLAFRSPASALAIPAAIPGEPESSPGPVVSTAIHSTWLQLPALPTSWKMMSDKQSEGIWLSGLIDGAASRLTPSEQDALLASIKAGKISDEMLNSLIAKRNEAMEAANIANRRWMRTTISELEMIPEKSDNVPLSDAQKAALIQQANFNSYSKFQTALARAQSDYKANDGRILYDGLPAVTLTYGNNFTLMRIRYAYKLNNGTEVSFERITPTPFFLVDQIRANPMGHVFEIFMAAAVGEMIRVVGVPNSLLARGEKLKLESAAIFRQQLQQAADRSGVTIGAQLKAAIEEFFRDLEKWVTSQTPGDGVATPFIPPSMGTPMLNFFPSPYEWSLRRDEAISEILTSERQTPIANQFRSGSIVITNPPPFP